MRLTFIGEMGIYLSRRDAVKITAVDGDRVIECYATRSALQAIGCPDTDEVRDLIRYFQRQREAIEIAAMVKYRRALGPAPSIEVTAADLAAVFPATAA